MKNIINVICKYDPSFRKQLEQHYLKCCPRLAEVEKEFIPHLIYGVPLKSLTWEDCLQVILSSLATTPYFEISQTRVGRKRPCRILRWEAHEIARDRFRYLLALKDKLPESCSEVFPR